MIYAVIVSVSALGALNANVFATGRLCVTASKDGYFPSFVGNYHVASKELDAAATKRALQRMPRFLSLPVLGVAKKTETLRWDYQTPVYDTLNCC